MSRLPQAPGAVARLAVARLVGDDDRVRAVRRRVGAPHRIAALARSGRFDVAFYQAQAGRTFATAAAAITHYLLTGAAEDLSPHPLYDPTVHLRTPDARHAATRTPFERFLADCRSPTVRPHLLFDPHRWLALAPAAAAHPLGAWGHYLDTVAAAGAAARAGDVGGGGAGGAGAGTGGGNSGGPALPIPVQRGFLGSGLEPSIAYDALVENASRHARTWAGQHRIASPERLSDALDETAARALERRLEALPAPAPVGDEPVVSIITPVRNRPGPLLSAIASVLRQRFQAWELLVVDDGSTDATAAVAQEVADRDPRIRVLRRPAEGVCAARNAGAAAARGRYLAWLDSDTTWEPDYLRLVLTAMDHDGLRAAHAAQQFTDHEGRARYRQFNGGRDHLAVGNFVDLNVLVAERSLVAEVGGFDTGLRRAVDYDLVLRLAAATTLAHLPIVGSVYADDLAGADRIGVRELRTWNYVVRERAFLDWDDLIAAAGTRDPGLHSVLLSVHNRGAAALTTVAAVLAGTDGPLEVVAVDTASRLPESLKTGLAELLDPARVRVVRAVVNLNTGVGFNLAFARSRGGRIVLLVPGVAPDPGWLPPLAAALDAGAAAAAPVLVDSHGLVASAGMVFARGGSLPVHLLAGLPTADADRLAAARGGAVDVPAASGHALVVRAADYAGVHGWDPLYVNGPDDADLCLRLTGLRGAPVRVVATERVRTTPLPVQEPGVLGLQNRRLFLARWRTRLAAGDVSGSADPEGLWADAGFEVLGYVADEPDVAPDAVQLRPLLRWRSAPGPTGVPRLRWTVDLTGLKGTPDRLPGVVGSAAALVRALGDRGQAAAVRRPAAADWPVELDDVVIAVPGREAVRPVPAVSNVLWLPEDLPVPTGQEALGFAVVLSQDAEVGTRLVDAVAEASARLAGRPTGDAPALVVLAGTVLGADPGSAGALDSLVAAVTRLARVPAR